MLIVNTRKHIPLFPERRDWNPDSIQQTDELTAVIPICDKAIRRIADSFAYEIAKNQPWMWPDLSQTTVALRADLAYSFPRFDLVVGTKPSKEPMEDRGGIWAKFEAERQNAIKENKGVVTYDNFPLMLTKKESQEILGRLYDVLNMY